MRSRQRRYARPRSIIGLVGATLIVATAAWVLFAEDADARLLLILLRRLAQGLF